MQYRGPEKGLRVKLSSKVGMEAGEAQPVLTALRWQDSTRDTCVCRWHGGQPGLGFTLTWICLFKGPNLSQDLTDSSCPHGKKKVGTSSFLKSSSIPVWENNEERKPVLGGLWCVTRGRIMGCKWGGRIPFGDCTNAEQGVGLWFSNGGTTSNKTPLLIAEGRVSEIQVNSVSHRKQLGKK